VQRVGYWNRSIRQFLSGLMRIRLSPFGALGGIHDLVVQLVVTNFVAHICQSLCDVWEQAV
jgi:hypothetical protein